MAEEQQNTATEGAEKPSDHVLAQAGDDFTKYEDQRQRDLEGKPPLESPENATVTPSVTEDPKPKKDEEGDPKVETAGGTETSDETQETGSAKDPADKAPEKKGFQKRINTLTRQKREAEDATRKANDRIAELEAKPAGDKPDGEKPEAEAKPPKVDPNDPEPKPEDFEHFETFSKEQAKWVVRQDKRETAEADAQTRNEEAQREAFDQWTTRLDAAREVHDDFDDVVGSTEAKTTPAMEQAIIDSEHGAELAYHLASNPSESERIAKLSPVAAIRELGRIEATLTKPTPETPTKKVTKAPDPVKPITGGSAGGERTIFDASDFNEYDDIRRAQVANAA